jgi:GT2 family glycosyltransferase
MKKIMHRFVFVILHYKAIQDTLECIESVLNNIASDDYSMVVVDNGSNDGTGDDIR